MQVDIGPESYDLSFQDSFSKDIKCVHCKGNALLIFVAHELGNESEYICDLYKKIKKEMWLHDACTVAVYLCTKCLQVTAECNQA